MIYNVHNFNTELNLPDAILKGESSYYGNTFLSHNVSRPDAHSIIRLAQSMHYYISDNS